MPPVIARWNPTFSSYERSAALSVRVSLLLELILPCFRHVCLLELWILPNRGGATQQWINADRCLNVPFEVYSTPSMLPLCRNRLFTPSSRRIVKKMTPTRF